MKNLIFILVAMMLSIGLFAQLLPVPQKMSYQAVIRNSSDSLVTNQPVGMKISILKTSTTGTIVYTETQTPITNNNGLISIPIGTGTVVSGNFSTIDWSVGPYFIKTEIDPTGGTAYSITATSELLSVPFALYAEKAGNGFSGNFKDLKGSPITLSGYGITDGISISHPANGITSGLITNWNTAYSWGNHAGLYRLASWVPSWPEVSGKPTVFTPSMHTHPTGDITDILQVTNGGTGASNVASARTNLGATTVGSLLFTLPNPSAIRFLKVDADNSVKLRTAEDFRNDIGAGTGNGTVTSIATSTGITGGPITSSGTISLTGQVLALHNFSGTGLMARTGSSAFAARTITAGSGIAVSNGNGISGNPVISTSNISTIGDFAHGGVVFWVDDTGEHGLVCAKNDQSIVRWYAGTYIMTMARGNGPLSGEMNTAIIIASQGGGDGYIYAARTCAELQMTEATKTYGDWYLPSRQELLLMYNNKPTIYATSTANGGWGLASEKYFSSTEFSSNSAWYVDFLNGAEGTDSKSQSFRIRAVRRF